MIEDTSATRGDDPAFWEDPDAPVSPPRAAAARAAGGLTAGVRGGGADEPAAASLTAETGGGGGGASWRAAPRPVGGTAGPRDGAVVGARGVKRGDGWG